jgi:hypothetical protein
MGTLKRICAETDSEPIAERVHLGNEPAAAALHRRRCRQTRSGGFNDIYAKNIFPNHKRLHTNADTRTAATRECSYCGWWLRRHR